MNGTLYREGQSDAIALLGPLAEFYFWQQDRLAAGVQLSYLHGLTDATIIGRLNAVLGVSYFMTPSVAFGPYFTFSRIFSRTQTNFSRYGVGASFGIFL